MEFTKQGQVIDVGIRINIERFMQEYANQLALELDDAGKAWEQDAYKWFKGIKFAHESEKKTAKVKTEVEMIAGKVKDALPVRLVFHANTVALADSYGTGSLMVGESENPGLKYYKGKTTGSGSWNRNRRGNAIYGRSKGQYEDLFGNQRSTSGVFANKNIENMKVNVSNKIKNGRKITGYYISPSHPSHAIQIANQYFYHTFLPNACRNAAKRMNYLICIDRSDK